MSLIVVAGFAFMAANSVAMSQQQVLNALAQCREIQHKQPRLQCFDRLAAAVTSTPAVDSIQPAPVAATIVQSTAQPVATPSDIAAPVATPATAIATASTVAATPDPVANFGQEQRIVTAELAEITAQVHSVKRDQWKKWIITLSNDQVWKQTDTVYLDLKAGDQVVIKRAALGSFMLGKAQVNSKIRVKRLN